METCSGINVVVPDCTSAELVARAGQRLGLTFTNPEFPRWEFMTDERGNAFEAMTWKPGEEVSSGRVRSFFGTRNYAGNTAAFLTWIMESNARGFYVTIPEDARLWCFGQKKLFTPVFDRTDRRTKLDLCGTPNFWTEYTTFVGFRPAKKAGR